MLLSVVARVSVSVYDLCIVVWLPENSSNDLSDRAAGVLPRRKAMCASDLLAESLRGPCPMWLWIVLDL